MAVRQLARETVEVRLPEAGSPAPDAAAEPCQLSDAAFGRLFTLGALFGTPALYALLAGIGVLAGAGLPAALLAAAWPAVVAGWYFGGIVVLTVEELRKAHAASAPAPAAPRAPAGRPVLGAR